MAVIRMLKLVPNLRRRASAARLWVKSLEYAAKRKNREALENLESIEELGQLMPEMLTLKGFVLSELGQYASAVEAYLAADERLDTQKGLSKYDLAYLRTRIYRCANYSADAAGMARPFNESLLEEIDFGLVSESLKLMFPLSPDL